MPRSPALPLLLSVMPLRSFEEADYLAHEVPGVTIGDQALQTLEKAGRGAARAAGLELAASLLRKARPLVSGVILAAPDDDPAAPGKLIAALADASAEPEDLEPALRRLTGS